MIWAQFDNDGNVVGVFANPQPDIASVVAVGNDDPRVVAFLSRSGK